MPGQQKSMTGKVVSDKMDKTVVVIVESTTRHRLYHKIMRRTKRYLAHDDRFESKPGDLVRIMATSPISRHKRWRVAEVLRRGEVAEIAPRDIDKEYLGTKREKAIDEADAAAEQPPTPPAPPTAKMPEPPTAEAAEAAPEDATAEAGAVTETDAVTEVEPVEGTNDSDDAGPAADAAGSDDADTASPANADADTAESSSATADEDQRDGDQ